MRDSASARSSAAQPLVFQRNSPAEEIMFVVRRAAIVAAFVSPSAIAAQGAPKVGRAHGTVVVVGGGSMGPEIYSRFIAAAGGPDALIIDVPTAGGDSVYKQDAPGTR